MTKTGGDYCTGVSLCVCAAGCYLSFLKVFLSTWHLRLELMLPADRHLTCNTLPPQLSAGPKVNATARRIDLYPSPTRRHARRVTCTREQAHSAVLAHTHACARLKYTHACIKSIIWQVSNPALVCCPPSPLPSSFFLFLFQHSFSTRTPVPLSINYLYCLRSDLRSPVRICMDGARQACLILCHREFSIFI